MLDVEGRGAAERQGRKGKRSISRLYSPLLSAGATVVTASMLLTISRLSTKQCGQTEEVKEWFVSLFSTLQSLL